MQVLKKPRKNKFTHRKYAPKHKPRLDYDAMRRSLDLAEVNAAFKAREEEIGKPINRALDAIKFHKTANGLQKYVKTKGVMK